ncbi:MAG: sulfatase-like hydrolase/transferase [Thermoplasmata archaeon]|nr:sulfatase-like hydrolase/transferase [Thermoplasmata archaeon]
MNGAGTPTTPATNPTLPDLVIVVMDCVRADDFAAAIDAGLMPFAASLRARSTVFPRAVAPCSWTVPSHASLFTGLYPWEHGAHAKSNLKLSPDVPRITEQLKRLGYTTLSLSANHLISPDLGLVSGIDRAAWAGWWEPYYRGDRPTRPPHLLGAEGEGDSRRLAKVRGGALWGIMKRSSHAVHRYPFLLDAGGRFVQRLKLPGTPTDLSVSPWIEPTLARWLSEIPREQPFFAFVNLLEAHEPYYPGPELAPGLTSWIRWSGGRQDGVGWLSGRWNPTAQQFARLHGLCREMFRAIDRRLASLVQALQQAGRWENTVLVLTSDHGQAFGEHGSLFHMLQVHDPLLRIPLWLRLPHDEGEGRTAVGWASLIDVVPTLLSRVGTPDGMATSGVSLERLVDEPRPTAVYAMADGLVWTTIIPDHERERLATDRRDDLDRVLVAGYEGDRKLVFDATRSTQKLFDLRVDPGEDHDLWAAESAGAAALSDELQRVGRRLLESRTPQTPADVEERLRSWGYI